MSEVNIEELFVNVSETATKDNMESLYAALDELSDLKGDDVANGLELLFDAWAETVADDVAQRNFIISIAELNPPTSPAFRNILADAIKASLPPYLRKPAFVKNLGLRDVDVHYKEVVTRFNALTQLKVGVYTYQTDTNIWGMINAIDEFAGNVTVSNITGRNSLSVPLTTVLSKSKIFKSSPNVQKLVRPFRKSVPKCKDYFRSLDNFALTYLSDKVKKTIANTTLVPTYMTQDELEEWLVVADDVKDEVVVKAAPAKRGPSDARSLHEMHILLKAMVESDDTNDYQFTEDEVAKFKAFFAKDSIHLTAKDILMLAESISYIGDFSSDEMLVEMMTPLLNQYTFWADHPESVALIDLEIWGKVPAKRLPQFIRATEVLHSDEYIARYITVLPMRCLNSLCDHVDHDLIKKNVFDSSNNMTSDILLWSWKNRKKGGKDLLSIITMENVVTAISTINLPSAWLTAQRELKKLLLDNAGFQKIIIDNAPNAASIVFALQACKAFGSGEQQSLLVKLSRESEELQHILENGIGEQMIASAAKTDAGSAQAPETQQPLITSFASYNKRVAELDDIVKVQIPENKQAIATAREHGDLKENSEYKYAKQNQALINSRRADLEMEIANAQPIDFKEVEVAGQVVIGCSVEIELEDKSTETYHVVGAWDGNPEKGLISYKTPTGEVVYGRKTKDTVNLPDGRDCVIKSISELPAVVQKELAE